MESASTKIERSARSAVPEPPCGPGSLIGGKYRLQSRLGEGGMGTVWLARNETLDAPVALKLIRAGMQREETVTRLLREAHVEARLKHPNIVRVFDFGRTELGDAFIVMEVLDGISLRELLDARGRLGAVEAVQLLLPVLGALCHAHENGVVHRDLKPDNVFLDRGGLHAGTKLLDFGIAKLTGDLDRHITPGGTLVGSPAYMAPEQAQGSEDVDHRVDVWAICMLLYEAISGAPAFPGVGYAVLRRIVQDEPPPLSEGGLGEAALWQVLSRGLRKDPASRFQSMRELGTALAQWLCDQGESEDLDGNRISRRWHVIALGRAPPTESSGSEDTAVRPRRHIEMLELQTTKSFARSLRPFRMGQPTGAGLRVLVGSAFVIAVLLVAPSRLGDRSRAVASAEASQQAVPVDASRVEPPALGPKVSPPLTAPSVRPVPVRPKREQREVSSSRRPARRVSESDLDLKVPY